MQLVKQLWYPILLSSEVKQNKPLGVERLGQKLVLWRDTQAQLHCHADRCPHLGAALSLGEICADRLVCPFHGFEFDTQGQCQHIPANGQAGKIPAGMSTPTYLVQEAHGFVWLWWGEPQAEYPPLPFFDDLNQDWQYHTITADWQAHYTRAIENQLDVAHLAFVHRSTIGAGGRSFVQGPYVEADDQQLKIWVLNEKDQGQTALEQKELAKRVQGTEPSLHLLYPGVWKLSISPTVKNLITFVPINAHATRYYLRAYFKTRNALKGKLITRLMSLSNPLILRQDHRVVISQWPQNSLDADAEHLIGADRAIAKYRQWLRKHLRDQQAQPPSERPLPMAQSLTETALEPLESLSL